MSPWAGSSWISNSLLFGASGSWPFSARPICSATLLNAGDRGQSLGDARADARGFGERNAGTQRGMRNQVVLAKIRQQARAEQRQQHGPAGRSRSTAPARRADAAAARDGPLLRRLAVPQPAGLRARAYRSSAARTAPAWRSSPPAATGRPRPETRSPAAGRMRPAGRRASGSAGTRPPPPPWHRTPAGALRAMPRAAAPQLHAGRAAAPARDVLDVDDGIVDHHAQCHHQAAEAHGVERDAAGWSGSRWSPAATPGSN